MVPCPSSKPPDVANTLDIRHRSHLLALRTALLSCQIVQTDAGAPAVQAVRRKLRSFAVQADFPNGLQPVCAGRPRAPVRMGPRQGPLSLLVAIYYHFSLSCRLLGWLALLVTLVVSGSHQSCLHVRP